jgi:arylsulfatase A
MKTKPFLPIPMLRSLLLLFSLLATASAIQAAPKPNFIVIFCDNLGYGDIEPFGSKLHRTPHLNRMAAEGRKFTHFCVTSGVCTPSRASIMTGCYSQRVGLHYNERDGHVLRPVSPHGLNPAEITVAESLKALGYRTAIIGKWHLGDQPEFLPNRQGFDRFYGVPYSDDMTEAVGKRLGERLDGDLWPPLPLMENERVIEAPVDRDGLTRRYTERALEFITENRSGPFFLYLPQAMPGSTKTPYSSPAFKGKSRNGPWGDSVEELDWSTGKILDHLVELGIEKNTLVIWTSDNGAPISPTPGDLSRGSNLPLYGRGYTTAEGAFRVPTLMWQPGTVPAGTVCNELATTMDLLPTFARMAGGREPQDRIIDGHDISPLINGTRNARSPYKAFYYYNQRELHAVRSGPWKLFLPLKDIARHPHYRKDQPVTPLLFNVEKDIACKTNVAAEHPDIVKRLTGLAEKARADLGDNDRPGKGQRPIGTVKDPKPQKLSAR